MKKVITKNPRPIKRNYCWKKQGELKKNKIVISDEFKLDMVLTILLDTKKVNLLNHYLLFYLR